MAKGWGDSQDQIPDELISAKYQFRSAFLVPDYVLLRLQRMLQISDNYNELRVMNIENVAIIKLNFFASIFAIPDRQTPSFGPVGKAFKNTSGNVVGKEVAPGVAVEDVDAVGADCQNSIVT
uniref:Uncharacterized protein n=1 Tax=Glossina pallidipes TaxID=7398 RepID=A0A1A9ZMM9_GLOPL